MGHHKAPPAVQAWIASPPPWLGIQSPNTRLVLPDLDAGEVASISLAVESQAALLIDEQDGRAAAQALGLSVVGAIGVLERAAIAGFIADLGETHGKVRALRFHVADAILVSSLERYRSQVAIREK